MEQCVPWIIDYETVLQQMKSQGFKCLYYNSGAFGFPETALTRTLAWTGPEDPTVKPAARELMRPVGPPYETNLATMAAKLWQQKLLGRAWLMPMSHWSYELSHGSREWMPALIENLDVDPGLLENRNNAAAIEFGAEEIEPFTHFVGRLLLMLNNSDFMIAFPGRGTLCTVHHHKQLWWTTTDDAVLEAVEELAVG
jgi:hypothetical protein